MFNVIYHPLLNFRNSESDLYDKVNHHFHPLIDVQLIWNKILKQFFKPCAHQLLLSRWFPRLKHVLEENQEGFDLFIIVLLQSTSDSLPHLLQILRIVVAPMDVCFWNCCYWSRFSGSAYKLLNKIGLWHDKCSLIVTQSETRILMGKWTAFSPFLQFEGCFYMQCSYTVAHCFNQVLVLWIFAL